MEKTKTSPTTVDDYISGFPADVQVVLQTLRQTIHAAAPDAVEKISYQMPTFALEGNLVHFAAFKKHIGFYPAPRSIEQFKDELSVYKGAKGSVQFPLDQPLPLDLVRRIVEFRVAENLNKAAMKASKKKQPSAGSNTQEG